MSDFLLGYLYFLFGFLALYFLCCGILAYVAPAKFAAYKAWNIRNAAARKARRAEKRRVAKLPAAATYTAPVRASTARRAPDRSGYHHHDHHGDPLLHGVIAAAATSSLRGDIEEAIAREAASIDSNDADNW